MRTSARYGNMPWMSQLQQINIPDLLRDVWNAELYKSGDVNVQLNQLVISLFIIVVGSAIARFVAKQVGKRLGQFAQINRQTAYVLQRVVFYVLLVAVVLIALPIAGIPITIFTVLGGAVAIGVGFGAQNLFNNLISGIIIITQRPIRIGDILEIDGEEGRVEDLGNRCVRVRRSDGVDLLVPNSYFLENTIANWTLFDSNVRGKVSVGVAYGSDTIRVRDLMLQAVDEHERIQKDPPPIVLFTEFGDNSLNFLVLFWTSVTRPMDLRRIQSDLRFRIDALFREAKIEISFPQRDVHLDTLKPLQIRMMRDGDDT